MPRRPRVLLVTRIFTPEAAAASFRLLALVRALGRAGVEVEVLTARPPDPGRDADAAEPGVLDAAAAEPGVLVRRWPVLRDASGYVRGYVPYLSFDVPLTLRLALARRPDVVVVEPPPTTGAVVRAVTGLRSLRRRLPYVYYAADIWSDATAATGAPAWVVSLLRAIERFALRGASAVVAVSDGVADRATDLADRGDVYVVPNGIDTGTFSLDDDDDRSTGATDGNVAKPAAAPSPIGAGHPRGGSTLPDPADGPFLLYAGTASEWQGAEVFAEAMRRVVLEEPGARLVFLGQGSAWPRLQQVAAELPEGAIELRPLVPAREAAAWHRAARAALVSVRPGLGYDFAYPTKVLAALACGTPVVYAGPGPAVDDLRSHALGEAVPYRADDVAEAMLRAWRRPADPQEARRRAAWVREHRSLDRAGDSVAAIVLAGVRGAEPARSSG